MNTYPEDYAKAIKYSARLMADSLSPDQKLGTVHADNKDFDHTQRLAFADSLSDEGRDEEAEHVRDLTKPIRIHPDGRVEPVTVKYRDVFFHTNEDANDAFGILDNEGVENYAQNEIDNDQEHGHLGNAPAYQGSEILHKMGDYTLSGNRGFPFINLQKREILPLTSANHEYMDENGQTRESRYPRRVNGTQR